MNQPFMPTQQQQAFSADQPPQSQYQNPEKYAKHQDKEIQFQQIQSKDHHMTQAYKHFANRLCNKYLIAEDINNNAQLETNLKMKPGNMTYLEWEQKKCMAIACCFLIYPYWRYSTNVYFDVQANHFALVARWDRNCRRTEIYGPGFHELGRYSQLLGIYTFQNFQNIITSPVGDLQIALVDQGTIMHFELGGQNIILGPGVHLITDPMQYQKIVNLDSFYIQIGPEKWVTIPGGYDGVSVNLGQIKILEGGKQHHLPHIGDKFVKMVPKTLQTDRIPTDVPSYVNNLNLYNTGKNQQKKFDLTDPAAFLHTTTSEGSSVTLDAQVFWKIVDTRKASERAMEILKDNDDQYKNQNNFHSQDYHIQQASANINNLRQTLLRQVKHHLTAAVGQCSLASDQALGLNVQKDKQQTFQQQLNKYAQIDENLEEDPQLQIQKLKQQQEQILQESDDAKKAHSFDLLQVLQGKSNKLILEINETVGSIGVNVESICIYSVQPSPQIQSELDKQTKSRVDANTSLIQAAAQRQKIQIETAMFNQKRLAEANAEAESVRIKAQAQAEALKLKAQGDANAAEAEAQTLKIKAEAQATALKVKAQGEAEASKAQAESIKIRAEAEAKAVKLAAEGEAEAIELVAKARKLEAEQLESNKIAADLATIRVAGEAGERMMSGASTKFVFGKNPGEVLFNIFNGIQGSGGEKKQIMN